MKLRYSINMKSFQFAFEQSVPILFSYLFIGLAYGMMLREAGYGPIWAAASGFFIYAGSMQIVMVSLMNSGVSLFVLAAMTLFINARHFFYGLGFVERFRGQGKLKCLYMALAMTDETYSLLCSMKYPENINPKKADFYIEILCHSMWVLSCTAGALAGELLKGRLQGIEFCATAFFVTVVINQWRQFRSKIPVLTGFISAVLFYFLLGPDRFILPALSVSLIVLVIFRDLVEWKKGGAANE